MATGKPRPMRAGLRGDASETIHDEQLEKDADEIRYPKAATLQLKSGEIELHELAARAQRSFAGLALRVTGEARASGGHFASQVAGWIAHPRYVAQFLPFVVAALQPASDVPDEKQFEKLSQEVDERFASPMGAADLAEIFVHMCERYEIPLVIGALPKM